MVSCVFPGSFDPVTKGHLDLIARASAIFEHVTVTVMINVRKSGSIPVEKRISILKKVCVPYPNVDVDHWEGLLSDYMHDKQERIIIRGLRSSIEMEQEILANSANRMLNSEIETLFLPTDPAFQGISSSAVREISAFGGDISAFVPESVRKEIEEILSKKD